MVYLNTSGMTKIKNILYKKGYFKLLERYLGGHVSIGRVTIYGLNAMAWGVTIDTKKYGYICFRLPFTTWFVWQPLYFYFSPNGTPTHSTLYYGKSKDIKEKSKIRKELLGHGFKLTDENYKLSYMIYNWNDSDKLYIERMLKLNQIIKL